jgi:hypothetical protein
MPTAGIVALALRIGNRFFGDEFSTMFSSVMTNGSICKYRCATRPCRRCVSVGGEILSAPSHQM